MSSIPVLADLMGAPLILAGIALGFLILTSIFGSKKGRQESREHLKTEATSPAAILFGLLLLIAVIVGFAYGCKGGG